MLHLRLSPVEALQAILVAPLSIDELLNLLGVSMTAARGVALAILVAILVDAGAVPAGLLMNIFTLLIRAVLIFLVS